MSELKTLKDLRENIGVLVEGGIVYQKLKQEAIKRVKGCKEIVGFTLECRNATKESKCGGCKRDIWFNNITEEDLK